MKIAYLQLALAMIIVGVNVTIGKMIVQSVPVFMFSEIRFFVASIILLPLLSIRREFHFQLTIRHWAALFSQAFFGVFLFSIFMLYGVQYTSAISAGVLTSTTPAIIALLAIFLRERLNIQASVSVVLAVVAILLTSVTFHSTPAKMQATSHSFGNALILLAVICEALFTIFSRFLSNKLSPYQLAAGVNLIGLVLFLPFSIHDLLSAPIYISAHIWFLMLYYTITASVISFVLWYMGVAKIQANTAGLFTSLMPIAATVAGIVLLNETFTASQMIGLTFALLAIFIGTWQRPKHNTKNTEIHIGG